MADENQSVVADVAELAAKAESVETTQAILGDVIDSANERVAQAEQTAEQITAAAMESARGQEITQIRQELASWQNQHYEMKTQLETLQTEMANLSALLTVQAAAMTSPPALSSLTPATSEIAEAITEVQQILPGTLQNAAAENPVVLTPAKRARLI